MSKRVRAHLTFANVASALALFIALGGSAYAVSSLGKNDVRSRNIAPRAVKKSDLHKNAVKKSKVADNAIGSQEVGADSLTGGDLNESTLDSSIQRSIQNLCGAGQAIAAVTPQGQPTCVGIPGSVDLTNLQNQVNAILSQLAGLQSQVDALCDTIVPAIDTNFDALDAITIPVIPAVGNVTLPNIGNNLPACP